MKSSRRVLVLTKHPSRSGVEPVIRELEQIGDSFQVADLASAIGSITITSSGACIVEQDDGAIWEFTAETSIFAWHEGRPAFITNLPSGSPYEDYVRDSQRVAWDCVLGAAARWMNNDLARRSVGRDKMLQERLARGVGLPTIPTVLTSSRREYVDAVERFAHDSVAVKSPVQWQTWTSGASVPLATYTRKLSRDEALAHAELVDLSPVYVQPYVEKQIELRIYVIGNRILAASIDSQASERTKVDWRHYDLANVQHAPYVLPDPIAEGILRLTRVAGLSYAAIDMIVEPSGAHRFVEINPSGQFGWIEALTGLPIARSIAEELMIPNR